MGNREKKRRAHGFDTQYFIHNLDKRLKKMYNSQNGTMRAIAVSFFFLLCCASLLAETHEESKTRYYRHELNIGRIGLDWPEKQWANYETKVYDAISVEPESNGGYMMFPTLFSGRSSSGMSISYFYHINHYIAIGATIDYTTGRSSLDGILKETIKIPYDYWDDNEQVMKEVYIILKEQGRHYSGGNIKGKSLFIMPSLKLSWLNNSWCSLYMKTSVGLHSQHLRADTGDYSLANDSDLSEDKTWFAYVITPFGWEIGKQKVRGFLEFGFGSNANIQIGLTYRIKRFK